MTAPAQRWPAGPVSVRVPATSANLGPGFDALGLALGLHDRIEAQVRPGGLDIRVEGEGAETEAAGERHLVVRAMREAFRALGEQPPGIALRCRNAIPHGFGLGSSAAAIVGGMLAAAALAGGTGQRGGPAREQLFSLAVQLEGHPDNVAACLAGGLTIAWSQDGRAAFTRLRPAGRIRAVVCVPRQPVATEAARRVLPAAVPHADAVANAARAALLVTALTADPALLFPATEDFLHQRYRAAAMPASAGLIECLRGAGIPAVLSGAGPSVLALIADGIHPGPDRVAEIADTTGGFRPRALPLDPTGAHYEVASRLSATE
jgi:homoserine kinase